MGTSELKVVQIGFALLTFFCLVFLFLGLLYGLDKSGYPKSTRRRTMALVILAVVCFITLVSVFSIQGVFSDFSAKPPKMFFVIIPTLLVSLFLTFSGKLDRILQVIPQSWILYLQSFRILVELFLWRLFVLNLLPIQMTFEGINWDVLTGITAVILAAVSSKLNLSNRFLIAWNIFGLILLVNIVVVSILSLPVPFRVFMNEPANTIVTKFPVSFLPTILVPLAYNLHFFSLRKAFISQKKLDQSRFKPVLG